MTVVLPNNTNPPHVQAHREEFASRLAPIREQLAELSCDAFTRGEQTKLFTRDFFLASERIDAAWRALGAALDTIGSV